MDRGHRRRPPLAERQLRFCETPPFVGFAMTRSLCFIYPSVHRFIYPSVRASEFDCVISRLKIVGARSARSFSLSRQCRDGSLGFHKAYFIGPLKKARIIRSRALMARRLRSKNLGCIHAAFPMSRRIPSHHYIAAVGVEGRADVERTIVRG